VTGAVGEGEAEALGLADAVADEVAWVSLELLAFSAPQADSKRVAASRDRASGFFKVYAPS
jgi:hypothetical protein